MLSDSLVQSLIARSLDVVMPRASLSRGDGGHAYEGPAHIRQEKDGSFAVSLYSTADWSHSLLAALKGFRSGELITESQTYTLTGTDIQGNHWSAWGLLPRGTHGPGGSLISARVLRLVVAEVRTAANFDTPLSGTIQAVLSELPDVPYTDTTETRITTGGVTRLNSRRLNRHQQQMAECHVTIVRQVRPRPHLDLRLQASESLLGLSALERYCEALSFVGGRPLSWRAARFGHGESARWVFQAPRRAARRARVRPVLGHPAQLRRGLFWWLVDKYFTVTRHRPDQRLTDLGAIYFRYFDDSAASIETFILGACTAVESALRYGMPTLAAPDTKTLEHVKEAERVLSKAITSPLKPRLLGLLGQLRQARAADKLLALQALGVVTANDISAWKALRNHGAHGGLLNDEDDAHFQITLNQLGTVETLLHKLYLQLLEYSGPYIDYGMTGWPEKSFVFAPDGPYWPGR